MNATLRLVMGSVVAVLGAGTALGNYSFSVNQNIPDGNPVGLASVGTISGLADDGTIADVSVGLNISGGYNGDLYGYLEAPNGATVVLMNQPGVTGGNPFGYGGSGFDITLSDAGSATLQNTPETPGAVVTGTYQPVGSFSTLTGLNGDGNWTLFVADMSDGGGQAVLNNWSLDVAPAPEPGQVGAMGLLGLLGAAGWLHARWKKAGNSASSGKVPR